jgi:hypothetical protein
MKKMSSMVVIAMLSVSIACGGGGGGDGGIVSPPAPPPPPPTCPDNTFCMRAASFQPITLTVIKGTNVSFQNNSGVEHNVVIDSQTANVTDIGDITSGTVVRTFNVAGTWTFHCIIHAGMTGSITVQ